jgi:cobalt transporter subunit CbtB
MHLSTTITEETSRLSKRLLPSVLAILLGLVILFGVGFVQGKADLIHNAAHDTRHAMAFPCH